MNCQASTSNVIVSPEGPPRGTDLPPRGAAKPNASEASVGAVSYPAPKHALELREGQVDATAKAQAVSAPAQIFGAWSLLMPLKMSVPRPPAFTYAATTATLMTVTAAMRKPGDDDRRRERQLDAREDLPRAHAHAARGVDHVGRHLADAGRDVADQDHERERHHADDGVGAAEAHDGDQKRQERERRDRVQEARQRDRPAEDRARCAPPRCRRRARWQRRSTATWRR